MGWFDKQQSVVFQMAQKRVFEFNRIAGNTYSPELQEKLIQEEVAEVQEAYLAKDKVAFLAEICDLFIVSCYGGSLTSWKEYIPTCATVEQSMSTLATLSSPTGSFLEVACSLLKQVNADYILALEATLDANMSKFSKYDVQKEQEYDTHSTALMADGRYKKVYWLVVEGMVVWKDGINHKVLKGPDFKKADVSPYVYK